jgi:hypothetical protein
MSAVLYEGLHDWLLEPENPSVRYWALQWLNGLKPDDPTVLEAQDQVMTSTPVLTILDSQNSEGYWVGEEDMYLPKYRATTHQLLILAELGCRKTPMIENGLEQIFRFQRNSGHFQTKLPKTARGRASTITDGCCLDGNILYYMARFGVLDDPRVQGLKEFLVKMHTPNSGWKCRAYPINPDAVFPVNCYMGAVKVLKGLSTIPAVERSDSMNQIIGLEVEKILDNGVYRYLRNPDGSRKDKAGWKRFRFPLFYQADVLEVLEVLTRLGVRDPRMEDSIRLLEEAQGKDGRIVMKDSFNGKMWIDIEEKKKPSKWLTLKTLTVLQSYRD